MSSALTQLFDCVDDEGGYDDEDGDDGGDGGVHSLPSVSPECALSCDDHVVMIWSKNCDTGIGCWMSKKSQIVGYCICVYI